MASRRIARQAGSWYPSQAAALKRLLEDAVRAAAAARTDAAPPPTAPGTAPGPFPGRSAPPPVAALLPHAGLHYSAACQLTGLAGFDAWQGQAARVLLLAPSHYLPLDPDRLYLGRYTSCATPLGDLAAWGPAGVDPLWNEFREAHDLEHAVELLLPALAWLLPDALVCPVLVPEISGAATMERLAGLLAAELDGLSAAGHPVLVLASSDITHYGPRFNHAPFGSANAPAVWRQVAERDQAACGLVAQGDSHGFLDRMNDLGPTMCGRHPALLLAALAARYGWRGSLEGYYRSDQADNCPPGTWPGTQDGDPAAVRQGFVSYQAIRFTT